MLKTFELLATGWQLDTDTGTYSYLLEDDDITSSVRVDILPDVSLYKAMIKDLVTGVYTTNDNGVVSVVCIDAAFKENLTVSAHFVKIDEFFAY